MTAALGVNSTLHVAGGQGDNSIDKGLINSQVEVWTDTYEAAALADPSTIEMAKLPAGAKVQKIELYSDALGASTTIDIGDSNDVDRYSAAPFDTSTAGVFVSDTPDGAGYVIGTNTGDETILLTLVGAAATGTLKTVTYFTR